MSLERFNPAFLHPGLTVGNGPSPGSTPLLGKRRPSQGDLVNSLNAFDTPQRQQAKDGNRQRRHSEIPRVRSFPNLAKMNDNMHHKPVSEKCSDPATRPPEPLPSEKTNRHDKGHGGAKSKKMDSGSPKSPTAPPAPGQDDVFPSGRNSPESTPSEADTGFGEEEDDYYGPQPWDIAQIVPRERVSAGDSFAGILKFLRFFMYIAIHLVVLICAVSSMGSMLLLTDSLNKDEMYHHSAKNHLIWISCLPQALNFLFSCFQTIFGNYPWPSLRLLCLVVSLELLHTFGLVLVIFHILPQMGIIYAIGLLNTFTIIPGLASLFFNGTLKDKSLAKTIVVKLADILSILITIGVIVLPLRVDSMFDLEFRSDKNATLTNGSLANSTSDNGKHNTLLDKEHLVWQVPLGFILVSVKWWENFVGLDRGRLRLYDLKRAVHNARTKLTLITSILNIACTYGFVYALDKLNNGSESFIGTFDPTKHKNRSCDTPVEELFQQGVITPCQMEPLESYVTSYIPLIITAGCSLILYYCSGLATKLLMQRFSLALPLTMASPVLAILALLQCKGIIPELPITSGLQYEVLCHMENSSGIHFSAAAILGWLCMLWTCRHIWFPNIERLSHYERIFVQRVFTGPLATQCIMLNRRNDEQDRNIVGYSKNEELDMLYKRVNGIRDNTDNTDSTNTEEKNSSGVVPTIYACATMWHENRNEMVQLLKSIFRMDADCCARGIAKKYFGETEIDLYDFETHVLFDDAMELDDDDNWIVNKFVVQLMDCMGEAASAVLHRDWSVQHPDKWATPYGGRLTWVLPGGTNLIIHLKDKNKIRHRKRWSQVMYMYYLLGYRFFDDVPEEDVSPSPGSSGFASANQTPGLRKRSFNAGRRPSQCRPPNAAQSKGQTQRFMRSEIFKQMEDKLIVKTENTFILALDGDVDFKPDAVRLLVDRMRINPKTGASCGRIHPIGSSPMVWYQKFEYAIGHWFQKSTEHVLGCVLCSPGCFSLFRASALLDDNVMKRYTTEPTEAGHYLQYDQGEDRWLCTLLLQQGYRVDYAAASDALTYAPETFNEFFNQRRRWTPSTIANIIDLLSDAGNTIRINPNISILYIFYQFFLMVSTVLGPATIILAIASAFKTVLNWELWECYLASLAPVFFYLVICIKCKLKTQLMIGALLSVMYSAIMTVVLVGIIRSIVTTSILNPSLLFLVVVVVCFIFAGLIHPYEFTVLIHGILYFLCIPAGYLVLMIYSMCNLHNVSWGTREVPKKKSKAQRAAEEAANAQKTKQKKQGWFSIFKVDLFFDKLKDLLQQVLNKKKDNTYQEETIKLLKRMGKELRRSRRLQKKAQGFYVDSDSSDDEERKQSLQEKEIPEIVVTSTEPPPADIEEVKLDDEKNPNWIKDKRLGFGTSNYLAGREKDFWNELIRRYLKPIKKDVNKEKEMAAALINLRNNSCFGFWFVNFLWVLFNYMIQRDSNLSTVEIGGLTTEPLGFVFLIFFLGILLLQLIGMIIHRWGTLLQLISITELSDVLSKAFAHREALLDFKNDSNPSRKTKRNPEKLVRLISQIQYNEPEPDYPDEASAPCDESVYAEVEELCKTQRKKRRKGDRVAILSFGSPEREREMRSNKRDQRDLHRSPHEKALRRNIQSNIRKFKSIEEGRHQGARREHLNMRREEKRLKMSPSPHRRLKDDRGQSHGLLTSVPEQSSRHHRQGRRESNAMLIPSSPRQRTPAHRQGRALLEREFVRRYHKMNSTHQSRV